MSETAASLPPLREELRLTPGPRLSTGEESWLIFDPVKNAYFRIGERAMGLLHHWGKGDAGAVLHAANKTGAERADDSDIEQVLHFLYANNLTVTPVHDDPSAYRAQEKAASPPLWRQAVHRYLFVKIPLVKPDRFLELAYPFVAPFFSKVMWGLIGVLALISLYLVSRQWDAFITTFLHFLSFEGALFYALTLGLIMSFHELGHAFAARHFRCRVSTIGLAFLVMFPVLYTDTTDAWRLKSRKQQILIDVAGMAVELVIAVMATLFWVFLPDGVARSAAFFAATTSWALSLAVNLNPFMRFDGYYILSDVSGVANLQARSFALGRWRLRKLLFGLNDPAPELFPEWKMRALTIYAWCTWIYRFFLFLGIALFVHAFFAKALGIILFVVEIGWFIAKPITDEVKIWSKHRMEIVQSAHGRATLIFSAILLLFFFLPVRTVIRAPAIASAEEQTEIFVALPGRLTEIAVQNGQQVFKGDVLFKTALPEVEHELNLSLMNIALTRQKLNRRVTDVIDRTDTLVLQRALLAEQERAAGLRQLMRDAHVRASHDGVINDLPRDLHIGQWVNESHRLARVIAVEGVTITALPSEKDIERLTLRGKVKFIPDDIQTSPFHGALTVINHAAKNAIDNPVFASTHGGPIAVEENKKGDLIPVSAVFEVKAAAPAAPRTNAAITGVAIIEATSESPATAVWRRITAVLIRETDF